MIVRDPESGLLDVSDHPPLPLKQPNRLDPAQRQVWSRNLCRRSCSLYHVVRTMASSYLHDAEISAAVLPRGLGVSLSRFSMTIPAVTIAQSSMGWTGFLNTSPGTKTIPLLSVCPMYPMMFPWPSTRLSPASSNPRYPSPSALVTITKMPWMSPPLGPPLPSLLVPATFPTQGQTSPTSGKLLTFLPLVRKDVDSFEGNLTRPIGEDVTSLTVDGKIGMLSGTSFANGYVAGFFAVLLSLDSTLTALHLYIVMQLMALRGILSNIGKHCVLYSTLEGLY